MSDFANEMKVLELLGALWSKNYNSKAPRTSVEANLRLLEQAQIDLQEAIDCTDRHTVPLWHREKWVALRINEAEGKDGAYPIPEGLVELPLLMNRITSPSLVWHCGIDFELRGAISFTRCPFEEELLPSVGEAGQRELILWGFEGKFDRRYLFRHFGRILDLEMPTSQQYKDILNAIFDILASGSTFGRLETLIDVLLGGAYDYQGWEGLQNRSGCAIGQENESGARLVGSRVETRNLSTPREKHAKITQNGSKIVIVAPRSLDKQLVLRYVPPDTVVDFVNEDENCEVLGPVY